MRLRKVSSSKTYYAGHCDECNYNSENILRNYNLTVLGISYLHVFHLLGRAYTKKRANPPVHFEQQSKQFDSNIKYFAQRAPHSNSNQCSCVKLNYLFSAAHDVVNARN